MTVPDNFMINENYQQFDCNNVSDINMYGRMVGSSEIINWYQKYLSNWQ